ncbi:hypothetical protein [Maliponia aquimaris]|nr:hypothetical protein [Maliponia aquimaris]
MTAASLGALMLVAGGASADQVFNDDVIVTFSLCVGNDCVNGENFGFDTIRMKENNVRLHFDDTSTSGAFPRNDWRLIANDSSNGGASYLAIEDSTAGRQVFRVEAGARANALYVESDGDIGVGTSNPAVDVHVVTGNTPTLRLDQDGSNGFTPQVWDLAGNETNFFVRDVTNGSKLAFRIEPNTPSNTLYLDSAGRVGVLTTSPAEALDVRGSGIFTGTAGTTKLTVEEANATNTLREMMVMKNNGNLFFTLNNTAHTDTWSFATASGLNSLTINANGGASEFRLTNTGNLILTGTLTTTGSCSVGCDAVFGDDYVIPSISARAAMMYDLGYLPNVGPTAESGEYDLTQKVLGMLNELEHAHIYIAQLNDRIAQLEARLATAD